ncbi:MAG: hypothetical protein XD81_0878 [Bacteroidetes bacterium 38_7]|nr:MAG: hypothetical protein XD81_0878 [Bacteroidetes bacterium 38_7]
MRDFLLLLIGFLITLNAFSQSDTEFWFAGPENESNNGLRDRPLYIRVATFTSSATITLSQPARPEFTPITVNVPANSTYTFNLYNPNDLTEVIETKPQNQVLNYGLKLTSTSPITAYYEQSSSSNPDIFTLKGRNALGTRFIVPFQKTYYNSQRNDLGGTKYSWFVVVATEDNTHVTIKPTVAIEGHAANIPFTITLNKGQTYACRSIGQSPEEHAAGTLITSDKPIAVTVNDDSVCQCQSCTNIGPDLIGDQIISYDVFGKEYIVVKGYFIQSGSSQSADHVYVFADSANTAIYINGTYVATINNSGEFYTYNFGDENAIYLSASKPVEVFHMSGYNQQPAGAVIPPIECTGSNEIVFTRSSVSGSQFGLILFTRSGNEVSFSVNPPTFSIPSSSFQEVPGTAGQWVYARLGNMSGVNPNTAYRISNSSGLFHLGVLYGNSSNNSRYGFFSNFASVNLGPDRTICFGDSTYLDAGAGRESYEWSTGETTSAIWVKDADTFWVHVTENLCNLYDTIVISYYPNTPVNLGPDVEICEGQTAIFNAGAGYINYLWTPGNIQTQTYETGTAGTYTVTVQDENGCHYSDTIQLSVHPLPTPKPIKHN